MKLINNPSEVDANGRLLIHEHVFCRFRTENTRSIENFLQEEFRRLADSGVRFIIDTTTYTTPDPICEIETDPRIQVGCSAGYYTESYVKSSTRSRSVFELAALLKKKVERGVGKRRFKPVMLKCGSGGSFPSKVEEKLISAVALVQRDTGLPLQIHSCDGAEEQFEIINKFSVPSNRVMYCHIEMGMKTGKRLPLDKIEERSVRILDRGSFIYFNDFGKTKNEYQQNIFELIRRLIALGYQDQLCVGTDSNWNFRRGQLKVRGIEKSQSSARTYNYIFNYTAPALLSRGVTESVVEQLCFQNGRSFILGK